MQKIFGPCFLLKEEIESIQQEISQMREQMEWLSFCDEKEYKLYKKLNKQVRSLLAQKKKLEKELEKLEAEEGKEATNKFFDELKERVYEQRGNEGCVENLYEIVNSIPVEELQNVYYSCFSEIQNYRHKWESVNLFSLFRFFVKQRLQEQNKNIDVSD